MKTFDINVPSQHKQRKVANAWVGDGIVTEDCPFTFPVKEKSNERQICSAPWGYIEDLPGHIMRMLDLLDQ